MPLNQSCTVQVKRHFGIDRFLRSLLLEGNDRLEDVSLRQIELDPTRCGRSEHVALLGHGFSEELGHAVELRLDAI